MNLPEYVEYVFNKIESNGYDCYVVGGAVRDYFLGKEPHDYDLVTNAKPEESYSVFVNDPRCKITTSGISHGTIKIWVDDYEPIDITMFGYNPRYVKDLDINKYFDKDINDDLSRRDFTMNAIAYDNPGSFIDIYDGIDHIKWRLLSFVRNPSIAIKEDPFLILRAYRQAISLDFRIEDSAIKFLVDDAYLSNLVNNVSGWRKGSELFKILSVDYKSDKQRKYLYMFLRYVMKYLCPKYCDFSRNYMRILSSDNVYERISILFDLLNSTDLENILRDMYEYDEEIIDKVIVYRG